MTIIVSVKKKTLPTLFGALSVSVKALIMKVLTTCPFVILK